MPKQYRYSSLSGQRSGGSKVKIGRTKQGDRYNSISTKFAAGGGEVKTTINKRINGKMRQVILHSKTSIR